MEMAIETETEVVEETETTEVGTTETTETENETEPSDFDIITDAIRGEESTSIDPVNEEPEEPVAPPEPVAEPVAEEVTETPAETPTEPVEETPAEPVAEIAVAEPASVAPVPAEPASVEPTNAPVETPEAFETRRQEWETQQRTQLNSFYSEVITDERVDEFTTDPRKALAAILTEAHMAQFQSLQQGFQETLPGFVAQQVQQLQQVKAQETAFFERWPQLRDQDQNQLKGIAQAYNNAKPQASFEEAVEEVGQMAMLIMKVAPPAAQVAKPVAKPKPKPKPAFRPTQPGGAAAPNGQPELNDFGTFFEEVLGE